VGCFHIIDCHEAASVFNEYIRRNLKFFEPKDFEGTVDFDLKYEIDNLDNLNNSSSIRKLDDVKRTQLDFILSHLKV
jgi:hypothetical protein